VRVGAGEVVLQVAPQVRALVAAESALRIATTPSGAPALELTRGELVAEVRPHPGRVAGRGQEREEPRFAVITPAGRCEVTGTVLAVSTRADATHLRVLRGAVRAVGRGGGSRRVAAEQGLELRRMKVRRLSAEELARARAQAARLALPATGADAARLVVRSQPAGAAATLDNIEIGTTPLALAVAAGPHQLRLRRAAHEPVTVMLATRAGETLERSFTLEPRRAKADAGAPDAGIDVRAGAGGTRARRPPRPRPRKVAATELLRETRRLRAARKWRAAAAAYRRLLRDHPRSAAAAAARVALGALYLDKLGKPGAALKLFDGYLARRRSGPLAQEAAYGRIRALRRLGRRAEELRAARRFLREHRGALQAPRVRRRLRALERRGGR